MIRKLLITSLFALESAHAEATPRRDWFVHKGTGLAFPRSLVEYTGVWAKAAKKGCRGLGCTAVLKFGGDECQGAIFIYPSSTPLKDGIVSTEVKTEFSKAEALLGAGEWQIGRTKWRETVGIGAGSGLLLLT